LWKGEEKWGDIREDRLEEGTKLPGLARLDGRRRPSPHNRVQ
jgi:hypothetical protein